MRAQRIFDREGNQRNQLSGLRDELAYRFDARRRREGRSMQAVSILG